MNTLGSIEEIIDYRKHYWNSKLLIDTNTLLLLFVGIYDPNYLKSCRLFLDNGTNYGEEDYKVLLKIVGCFLNRITITPQITAEIWSLSKTKIEKKQIKPFFKSVIENIRKYEEKHIPLSVISEKDDLIEFGFTDISLIEAAKDKEVTILTDEYPLHIKYQSTVPIIKFSNVIANCLVS